VTGEYGAAVGAAAPSSSSGEPALDH
jgi:hypothetical protein